MKVVDTVTDLKSSLEIAVSKGFSIGFVPTMGALHLGHISLVESALRENDFVVVSIFVNPTQFNNSNDLARYPRDLESDLIQLESTGCQLIFAPSIKEVYPKVDNRQFDFGLMGDVMEGKHRPGHFNGVAQVVSRLFDLINPQKAYFGIKDFQQIAIIKNMVKQMGLPVKIVECPIIRESDGLAMSSRNMLLTAEMRKKAPLIAQTLNESCTFTAQDDVSQVHRFVIDQINQTEGLIVEYFDIVDGDTLQSITNWDDSSFIVGCIAVFAGDLRLIDNIVYKKK